MYNYVLALHILGATVWTGGHLVLSLAILPGAIRNKDPNVILQFESGFEKIGIPALIVQIFTGFWLAQKLMPDVMQWFDTSDAISRLILVKITLLVITVILALHARLNIIPGLDKHNLKSLAWHIVAVTTLAVLFVAAGLGFSRVGSF